MPLTRLRGTAELALQAHAAPEQTREALADCVEESERVLSILNTLMDVTEAEAGMMRLDLVSSDLCQLLREVAEVYEFVADDKKIHLRMELPSQCPARIDVPRTRQVLANLLDNAIKYTPEGGRVTITTKNEPGRVVVLFRDTGTGIPPEELDKIWARLYRGDKSRSQRGLGLGLSLVKTVIDRHHGEVWVKSQPTKGSQFGFWLPLIQPEEGKE